ncbi:MAG: cobalamin-dependent protein [Anaerolineales bacterium]
MTETRNPSESPLYNIGVVTRMTGISKATLRAWERRYGFPDSDRTSGGHRLYSEKDIVHLRWVKARIDQGMQTAQAIRALRHQENLETPYETPAIELFAPQNEASQDNEQFAAMDMPAVNPLMAVYQRRLLQAFFEKDTSQADQILGEALASSSPEALMIDLIAPTLAQVGHAWENEKITIATEHLATNFLRHRLMMWMLSSPPARDVPPIVMACAPDEWHEMSLLMMAVLLRRRQYPVAYLGQAMPLPDLAKFVQDIQPAVITLVAMTENSANNLRDWTRFLPHAAQTGVPAVTYAGRVFVQQPSIRLQMPGLYLGDTLREGLRTIETLMDI